MKERPILFSAPMVRAILDGSKTQTRRVIKPQPWEEYSAESIKCEHYAPCIVDKSGEMDAGPEIFGAYSTDGEWGVKCPYGQPGDRLWVRETFALTNHKNPVFKADCRDKDGLYWHSVAADPDDVKWRPSIHMPRWASRITLEITGIRVERLQDISEADAIAEGIHQDMVGKYQKAKGSGPFCNTARQAFQFLWEDINGAESWAANPWIWVVEFKRVGK